MSDVGTGAAVLPDTPAHGWRRFVLEPARPTPIREWAPAYWLAVGTVCIGAFMNQLDASIVTVAFPTLQRQFGASVEAVTWVGLTYLLVLVSLITGVGRFADMVGRKLLYLYGFVLFVAASALCGLAPNLGALIAFRALQGVGAAMIQANSLAIIVLAVPRLKLGKALGFQGAAQALGLALGPTIGGLLITLGGWRLIFYVNVPTGLVAAALGWFLIPRSRDLQQRVRFDWIGLALFVPAVTATLSAVSFGNDLGWGSPFVLGLLALATLCAIFFVRRENRTEHPMLDLSLFRKLSFSAGIAGGMLSYVVLFGVLFVIPFYLERAVHQSISSAGLELAALPIALGLTAPFAGHAAERLGARALTVAGMALASLSMFGLVLFHGSLWEIGLLLALVGVALGLFTPPNNAAVMGSVPRAQSGVASGVLNMSRGMGTALGLATTALVFGMVAGGQHAPPELVARGFAVSAAFLGCVALAAMVLAALRGRGQLSRDPVALAE